MLSAQRVRCQLDTMIPEERAIRWHGCVLSDEGGRHDRRPHTPSDRDKNIDRTIVFRVGSGSIRVHAARNGFPGHHLGNHIKVQLLISESRSLPHNVQGLL